MYVLAKVGGLVQASWSKVYVYFHKINQITEIKALHLHKHLNEFWKFFQYVGFYIYISIDPLTRTIYSLLFPWRHSQWLVTSINIKARTTYVTKIDFVDNKKKTNFLVNEPKNIVAASWEKNIVL